VDQPGDVAAYLLAGADVVMTTSALLRHGPEHVGTLLDGLTAWMRRKGFTHLHQVHGMLAESVAAHGGAGEGPDRAGYLKALDQAGAVYGRGSRACAVEDPCDVRTAPRRDALVHVMLDSFAQAVPSRGPARIAADRFRSAATVWAAGLAQGSLQPVEFPLLVVVSTAAGGGRSADVQQQAE
jgi:hypothetical protein